MNLQVRDSANVDQYLSAQGLGTDLDPLVMLREQWRPDPLGLALSGATPDPADNDVGILQAGGTIAAPVAGDYTVGAATPQVWMIPLLSAWYRRYLVKLLLTSASPIDLQICLLDYATGMGDAIANPIPILDIDGPAGGWNVFITSEMLGVGTQIGTVTSVDGDVYQLPLDGAYVPLRMESAAQITVELDISRW